MQRAKIFLFCLLLIPGSVFGMTSLTDQELSDVNGQAGITLAVDDFAAYQHFGRISFIDDDGGDLSKNKFPPASLPGTSLLGLGKAASLNLENIEIDILRVNALIYDQTTGVKSIGYNDPHFRFTDSSYLSFSGSDVLVHDKGSTIGIDPGALVIDVVDELPCLSPGYNYMMSAKYSTNLLTMIPQPGAEVWNKVGIAMFLPSLDVYMDEVNIGGITVTDLDSTNGTSVNDGGNMMQIGMKGVNLASLWGNVEIAPHYTTGIDLAMDDIVMYLGIDELRFTDTDGHAGPGSSASLVFEGIKADLIKVNALTHTDVDLLSAAGYLFGSNSIHIKSPLLFDCHLDNLHNALMLDLLDVLKSYHGQPILLNASHSLGFHAMVYAGNEGYHYYDRSPLAFSGIMMAMGTVEVFMDSLSIDKVSIDDPRNLALNDGASFFPIKMRNVTCATLNGYMEISSH